MSIEAMKQALEALEMLARYENPETKIQVRKPKDGGPIVTMYPHKVASDAAAVLRAAIEHYDQTSLELCEECGWKAIIPGDGCLVCARQKAPRQWVELTDDEARALVNRVTFGDKTNWQALVYIVDQKLKEKNYDQA